jgi:manganese transport protein
MELLLSRPHLPSLLQGALVPGLPNSDALYLVAGVLGATVMPHVIYLHSALTQDRSDASIDQRLHNTRVDVAIAMTIAGFVNLAMMAMAAAAFHYHGHTQVAELESAYATLTPLLGQAAATLFGLSLVASGISSTVVGTLAGQVVMQSFVRFSIPLWLRRLITMAPAFVVIAMGSNTTEVLVMSQVVLSFGIALALIPLLMLTGDRQLMGEHRNHPLTQALGRLIVALVVGLNAYLLVSML